MGSLDFKAILAKAKNLNTDLMTKAPPPESGGISTTESVIYFSLVRDTRGYIERLTHQINGSYQNGYYDACAVMIRRLIETLIIETYEAHGISASIKNSSDDYLFLGDLISLVIKETSWTIGRNAKKSLGELKNVGDKSAHSRRFIAQRQDIDKLIPDLRDVVQELLSLSKLKR